MKYKLYYIIFVIRYPVTYYNNNMLKYNSSITLFLDLLCFFDNALLTNEIFFTVYENENIVRKLMISQTTNALTSFGDKHEYVYYRLILWRY